MLNKFQISKYSFADSLMHRIDPFIKILCLLICVILILIPHNILFDILILFGVFVFIYISKLPLKVYLNSILSFKWFYISIFLLNVVCGISIFSSIQMVLKIVIMVLYSQILVLTTSLFDMMNSFSKLLSPLKFIKLNIKQLTFCLSLAISFIPLILDQANNIFKSLESRGINYRSSKLKQKIHIIKSIIFPMFIMTLRRADNLAESLEVRQYNINSTDLNYKKIKYDKFDIAFLLIHIILLIVVIMGVIL